MKWVVLAAFISGEILAHTNVSPCVWYVRLGRRLTGAQRTFLELQSSGYQSSAAFFLNSDLRYYIPSGLLPKAIAVMKIVVRQEDDVRRDISHYREWVETLAILLPINPEFKTERLAKLLLGALNFEAIKEALTSAPRGNRDELESYVETFLYRKRVSPDDRRLIRQVLSND